jgi:ABC-type xylose transport system permease subunit
MQHSWREWAEALVVVVVGSFVGAAAGVGIAWLNIPEGYKPR